VESPGVRATERGRSRERSLEAATSNCGVGGRGSWGISLLGFRARGNEAELVISDFTSIFLFFSAFDLLKHLGISAPGLK
jgi:hypothetical protein